MGSLIQFYLTCTRKMLNIIQYQQQADVILPLNCLKESFTVYVPNNIDRKEETLLGTRSEADPEVLKKEGGGLQDLQLG